jgi:hypothetical protein
VAEIEGWTLSRSMRLWTLYGKIRS